MVVAMSPESVLTNGSNNLYVGGERVVHTNVGTHGASVNVVETSFWEIRCGAQDSSGDGTVPIRSGQAPARSGGMSILQQFMVAGIDHEGAYRFPATQLVTQYAITKLSAMAKFA